MEGESFRVMYEEWFVEYKVDVVFPGHVHAYERYVSVPYSCLRTIKLRRLCTPISDQSAPVYITIGAGGHLEGLVTEYDSFLLIKSFEIAVNHSQVTQLSGHGIFNIKNRITYTELMLFSVGIGIETGMRLKLILCGLRADIGSWNSLEESSSLAVSGSRLGSSLSINGGKASRHSPLANPA
ncbi:hypothetical protein DVH24_020169 [Malus domestica]|uniref:Iron/zinc purple acid phosphatase-like C-terminal domain-containing protein n=1 Tax=Malus domestica TaxID=3750 RepID=A0A498J7J7_MALDO|nr:hypothetical protein DVH24_020169 [Malus domestica]